MVLGGLRRCEVLGLRPGDLRFGERRVFIAEGKGGHQRLIPVSARRGSEIGKPTYPECVFPAAFLLREGDRRPAATDKDGGLGTITAAELGQDVPHVCIDGALGNEKPFSDLPVRQPPGDQLCDLVFAPGKREFLLRAWCHGL